MQSTYAALNGAEIRRLVKTNLETEIDKLPYLSIGNSFHRANIVFGFTMTAYPADVPCPEKDFEFTIDAASANSPEAIKQITKVENLDEQIAKLQEQKSKIENLLFNAQELRSSLVKESEVSIEVDGTFPDKARIQANLDVPVMETKGGKSREVLVPASAFKKVQA